MKQVQPPFSLGHLLWALATRQQKAIAEFEPLTLCFNDIEPSPVKHRAFTAMFNAPSLVCSYQFIDAFRYVGQLLAQSAIPSPLMGMIHLSTSYSQHSPHDWLLPTTIEVSLDHCRKTERGILYLLSTRYYQHGQLTLTNENTLLSRSSSYRRPEKSQADTLASDTSSFQLIATKQITRTTAWQYARLSSDFNPIHLHTGLAKLFGIKQALIHGMYNVHWSLSQLLQHQDNMIKNVQVKFNRPCYLPNTLALYQETTGKYALYSEDGNDRFLTLTTK